MTKHIYTIAIQFITVLILSGLTLIGNAGVINQWNLNNIVTEPGPYLDDVTYHSYIFSDMLLTDNNGAVIWVESDVMAPGLDVVVNDDVNGSNCIMTAGVNPNDLTVKQCSDPFQSSKRFKLSTTQTGSSLDLIFDVSATGGVPEAHRLLQKYLNSTDATISNIEVTLGFGLGEDFVSAPAGIGLDFSDRDGNIWVGTVNTGETDAINLDALFPFGLFGNAATDPNHDIDGYFDATARARFLMAADRGKIISTGISDNYKSVFGDFMAKSQAISGYFWDHDNDNLTDPILIAHQTDVGWYTLRPDQWWVDFMLPIPETNLLDGTLTEAVLAEWVANPEDYSIGLIEDLANLNMNYHVTAGDISFWPTYNDTLQSAEFTLRISSYSVIFKDGFD